MQKTIKSYSGVCSECVHWQTLSREMNVGFSGDVQETGECRRHTPMYFQGPGRVFPVTGFNDWCSEGAPRIEKEEKRQPWWKFWKGNRAKR